MGIADFFKGKEELSQVDLNDKLNKYFAGKVVRKDLTKKIKEGANVPVYVLEYLLGMYCATNDDSAIEEGVERVKNILAENFVRPDEAEKIKSKIKEKGIYSAIDKITVKDIVEICGISRQTFYYHFHDVYDLLTLVFLNEKLEKDHKDLNPLNLFKSIFKYYDKNSLFIDATLNSAGKDLFVEFIYNNCYTTFFKILTAHKDNKKLTINERKSIARFYGYEFANSIVFYFSNSKNKTYDKFMSEVFVVHKDFLEKAVESLILI